ncbi:IS701 family transposase [Streptomyces lasalocidi]
MLPLGVVWAGGLSASDVRSLDGELEALCASVDDVFARPASRENLRAMVRGLLSEVPRKNMWQLAEFAGHPNPDRLQGFLAKAAWDADEIRDRVRAYAVAALAADDAVLIADESGDIKKGTKTAGVQRQYTGTAGRIENAQVSVYLSYGSSRGRTLIDRELYLGRVWAGTTAEHERRCAEQGIPPERATTVATKPELARRMLERALDSRRAVHLLPCRRGAGAPGGGCGTVTGTAGVSGARTFVRRQAGGPPSGWRARPVGRRIRARIRVLPSVWLGRTGRVGTGPSGRLR